MSTSSTKAPRPRGEGPESTPTDEVMRKIGDDLQRISAEAATLARLRLDRARLSAREGVHTAMFRVWAALAGTTLTVIAAVLFALGLTGAISAAAGGELWLGALITGALGLLAGLIGLRWMRARMRRAFAADVERRFRRTSTPRGADT